MVFSLPTGFGLRHALPRLIFHITFNSVEVRGCEFSQEVCLEMSPRGGCAGRRPKVSVWKCEVVVHVGITM